MSLGYCEVDGDYYQIGEAGGFRWAAVKGVTAYTVIFNDGAYGGAEQRISVVADPDANPDTPPWPNDRPPEGEAHPEWNAPKGIHQVGWTGGAGFGPGNCDGYQPPDYSGRLTNPHIEYYRDGEYIDGTIIGSVRGRSLPPDQGRQGDGEGDRGWIRHHGRRGSVLDQGQEGHLRGRPEEGRSQVRPEVEEGHRSRQLDREGRTSPSPGGPPIWWSRSFPSRARSTSPTPRSSPGRPGRSSTSTSRTKARARPKPSSSATSRSPGTWRASRSRSRCP